MGLTSMFAKQKKQDHDFPFQLSDAEWRAKLTPEQYHAPRNHGTERAGSCAPNFEKRAGTFSRVGCDQPLFRSHKKFESGTGWPSFDQPLEGAVETSEDYSRHTDPRSTAPIAAAISAMSSPTARPRPACATASTASRWTP